MSLLHDFKTLQKLYVSPITLQLQHNFRNMSKNDLLSVPHLAYNLYCLFCSDDYINISLLPLLIALIVLFLRGVD